MSNLKTKTGNKRKKKYKNAVITPYYILENQIEGTPKIKWCCAITFTPFPGSYAMILHVFEVL